MTNQLEDFTRAEPRVLAGENPFDVDPRKDYIAEPAHDLERWSETMFFLVWSPGEEVGVWIHMGVVPSDKAMWWAQTFVYLRDGVVLVDRSFGRPRDLRGPDTGNLQVECLEPHERWRLTFDGAGELSSTKKLAKGPSGAGIAMPFQFEFEIDSTGPVYDMHAAMGAKDQVDWEMGDLHHEQGGRARGTITALGQTYEFTDGVVGRDHSRGERDYTRFGGHVWTYIVWPESERTLAAFLMWRPDMRVSACVGTLNEGGRSEIFSDLSLTGKIEPGVQPRDIELKAVRPDGSRLELAGEVVHNMTMTYAAPNHNLNGNWGNERHGLDDPVVADESVVRWRWDDGELGYGNLERGFKQSILPRPDVPLVPDSALASDD